MELRPDEIQYAGTVIRAWLSGNCRTWHVAIGSDNNNKLTVQ